MFEFSYPTHKLTPKTWRQINRLTAKTCNMNVEILKKYLSLDSFALNLIAVKKYISKILILSVPVCAGTAFSTNLLASGQSRRSHDPRQRMSQLFYLGLKWGVCLTDPKPGSEDVLEMLHVIFNKTKLVHYKFQEVNVQWKQYFW